MAAVIDWRAVGAGAALALAVLVATMVLVQVVDATVGLGAGSNGVFLFYAPVSYTHLTLPTTPYV